MNNTNGSCRRCGGVNARRYLQNSGCQARNVCGCQGERDTCSGYDGGAAYRDVCDSCNGGQFDYALAMVYSNVQKFTYLYDCDTALSRGTVFAELDKPFEGMTVTGCRR